MVRIKMSYLGNDVVDLPLFPKTSNLPRFSILMISAPPFHYSRDNPLITIPDNIRDRVSRDYSYDSFVGLAFPSIQSEAFCAC